MTIIKVVALYLEGLLSADEAMHRIGQIVLETDAPGVYELCEAIRTGKNIIDEHNV